MKKTSKEYLWAALAVLVMVLAYIALTKPFSPKAAGSLTIKVTDADQKVLKEKKIRYQTEDTLPGLVKANFSNVTLDNGMLMSIESLTTPADWSQFISIYQNGEMAMEGIETLPFKDGDTIEFRMTVYDPNMAW